jgi:hypothetical protein
MLPIRDGLSEFVFVSKFAQDSFPEDHQKRAE